MSFHHHYCPACRELQECFGSACEPKDGVYSDEMCIRCRLDECTRERDSLRAAILEHEKKKHPEECGPLDSPRTVSLHRSMPMDGSYPVADAYNTMRGHAEELERELNERTRERDQIEKKLRQIIDAPCRERLHAAIHEARELLADRKP